MTAFERAVRQHLMAVAGVVTHIVMENQLVDGLDQFFISFFGIGNPVSGGLLGGGVVQ